MISIKLSLFLLNFNINYERKAIACCGEITKSEQHWTEMMEMVGWGWFLQSGLRTYTCLHESTRFGTRDMNAKIWHTKFSWELQHNYLVWYADTIVWIINRCITKVSDQMDSKLAFLSLQSFQSLDQKK